MSLIIEERTAARLSPVILARPRFGSLMKVDKMFRLLSMTALERLIILLYLFSRPAITSLIWLSSEGPASEARVLPVS